MAGIGDVYRQANVKSGRHCLHPMRRFKHCYWNSLLGVNFGHHIRQHSVHADGELFNLSLRMLPYIWSEKLMQREYNITY